MTTTIRATSKPDRTPGEQTPCGLCGRMRQRRNKKKEQDLYCRDCKRPAQEMGWTTEGEE